MEDDDEEEVDPSLRRRRRFFREEEYSSSLKSSGVPIPHPPGYNCVVVSRGCVIRRDRRLLLLFLMLLLHVFWVEDGMEKACVVMVVVKMSVMVQRNARGLEKMSCMVLVCWLLCAFGFLIVVIREFLRFELVYVRYLFVSFLPITIVVVPTFFLLD